MSKVIKRITGKKRVLICLLSFASILLSLQIGGSLFAYTAANMATTASAADPQRGPASVSFQDDEDGGSFDSNMPMPAYTPPTSDFSSDTTSPGEESTSAFDDDQPMNVGGDDIND